MFSLILLYWLTRLIALDSLAFFIDEAMHAWWARLVWSLFPFSAASEGRLLNVLWLAAFWPFNASVWLSRASVILVTTAGLACVIDFARREFSPRAAIVAALLYTFMPLTFFFERLALADSISAPFVAGALWAVSRAVHASRLQAQPAKNTRSAPTRAMVWAAFGGVALTAAVFSKISNLIFLCIPVLAVVFLFPPRQLRRGIGLSGVMLASCFATLFPSALIVKVVGQSDLGLSLLARKTAIPLGALPEQIRSAGLLVLSDFAAYLPFPLWLFVLAGVVVAIWRGGRPAWFATGILLATAGALVARTSPGYLESRFLSAYAPLIVVLAGAGLAKLSNRWPLWASAMAMILVLGSGIQFAWQGWTRPESLQLTERDRWQYITGWPSGYGFREIAMDALARGEAVNLVTLDLGGQQRFEGYLLGRTDQVVAKRYAAGMSLAGSLLIIDTPKDDQDLAALNLDLIEMTRYPRPGGESALVVYRESP